jgi:tRNA dimethylallyltransferase
MSTSSILRISQLNLPVPLVVIVGPTAVGKTETALRLAERLGGEIVSVDSRLFYRGMDIGTAKPTPAEQARVPHHLIDVTTPDQPWSLAIFQRAAAEAIESIHQRDRLPLLVGGTGQYVRAVIQGWEIPPQEPDPALRAALESWAAQLGPHELHERLKRLDPDAAAGIDARNVRRTIRALEVTLRTGKRFSAQRQRSESPYSLLMVGLKRPRAELYRRVDERIDAMLASGLVEEVRALLESGYMPDLPTMSAIGYREVAAFLRGEMTLEEAAQQMKRLTRRFVRHQGAWFSEKDPAIHWFEAGDPRVVEQIEVLVRAPESWIRPGETFHG